ncbi:MAG: calcium-binding protein [Hyphomicrobiales bacterium]|nr:calcium-binding protein [Hyphomicrobiales bacterium]
MVTFTAKVAVNTQKLTELGYLSDFSDMKFDARQSSSMTAKDKDQDIQYELTGNLFVYSGKTPIAGTVKSINVQHENVDQYKLKHLSINVTKMDKYFSGSTNKLMQKIFDGKDSITGSDQGDVLYGYDGQDIINGGKGGDTINGGNNADTINGNSGSDTIAGAKGSDNINGGKGQDNITGGKGSDTIDGGKGNDTLSGGAGFNTFVFDDALDASSNVDTITDMTPGGDAIDLDKSVFTKLPSKGVLKKSAFEIGSEATSSSTRIVYDDSNGKLYYDKNGDGGNGQTLFAILDTGLALSNTDFFVI